MRKIKLVICMLMVCCAVHAQWRLGVSGGGDYNFYSIQTSYQTDYHYTGRWGATAAIFTQYNFLDWVALRAELEMVQKNHLFYRTLKYKDTRYVTNNTYLQLPVMTQFSFGGNKVRGFVNAGIYAGCWLDSHLKGTITAPGGTSVYPVDEKQPFLDARDQRWDFGLSGGIGLEYRFVEHWVLHLEGRCYYSFISTSHQSSVIADNRYNTTLAIQLGCAYIF